MSEIRSDFLVLYNPYFVGQDLIILLFSAFGRGVSVDPQTSYYMNVSTLYDKGRIRYVFAVPCDDVMPHAFICRSTFPCFVEKVCDHGEIGNLAAIVLVGADCAYSASELDSVDVFH